MKAIATMLGALLLVAMIVSTVAAQTDDKQSALMDDDAPWGLVIEFADGTTLEEANALRIKYDLELSPVGYQSDIPGRSFTYLYDTPEEYAEFTATYYSGNACVEAENCPPITPISAYYEPVSEEVEAALLEEDEVAKLSNRNDGLFFWIVAIKELFKLIFW